MVVRPGCCRWHRGPGAGRNFGGNAADKGGLCRPRRTGGPGDAGASGDVRAKCRAVVRWHHVWVAGTAGHDSAAGRDRADQRGRRAGASRGGTKAKGWQAGAAEQVQTEA